MNIKFRFFFLIFSVNYLFLFSFFFWIKTLLNVFKGENIVHITILSPTNVIGGE